MPKPTPSPASNDLIQEEALAVARSIQKPGQTKEQTRLIAQGIAKGIELYKRQQAAKSRERDKLRKRQQREKLSPLTEADDTDDSSVERDYLATAGAVMWVSGVAFLVMALFHFARWWAALELSVGGWSIPAWGSLVASLVLGLLALGSFFTALRLN
jgi:predicted phage tail protein